MYRGGVWTCVYRNTFYTVGSLKAKYRKLTRCVEVVYPPHVESMFHTPPLYMCRSIHCTVEGLHGQKRLHLATKHGFLFNSESVSFLWSVKG